MAKTRDERLLEIACQVRRAPQRAKKLVASRAWKLIRETVEDRQLQDELLYEFDEIAFRPNNPLRFES